MSVVPELCAGTAWKRDETLFIIKKNLVKWSRAKVHVYSDSVSCLAKMQERSEANQRWKSQLEEFRQSNSYKELLGTDGEPIEFE